MTARLLGSQVRLRLHCGLRHPLKDQVSCGETTLVLSSSTPRSGHERLIWSLLAEAQCSFAHGQLSSALVEVQSLVSSVTASFWLGRVDSK